MKNINYIKTERTNICFRVYKEVNVDKLQTIG